MKPLPVRLIRVVNRVVYSCENVSSMKISWGGLLEEAGPCTFLASVPHVLAEYARWLGFSVS